MTNFIPFKLNREPLTDHRSQIARDEAMESLAVAIEADNKKAIKFFFDFIAFLDGKDY